MKTRYLISLLSLAIIGSSSSLMMTKENSKNMLLATNSTVPSLSATGDYYKDFVAFQFPGTYLADEIETKIASAYNISNVDDAEPLIVDTKANKEDGEFIWHESNLNLYSKFGDSISLLGSGTFDYTNAVTDLFGIVVPLADVELNETPWISSPQTEIVRTKNGYDITYTAVGAYNFFKNEYFPVANLKDNWYQTNEGTFQRVYLYQTKDPKAGAPLTNVYIYDRLVDFDAETYQPEAGVELVSWRAYWDDNDKTIPSLNFDYDVVEIQEHENHGIHIAMERETNIQQFDYTVICNNRVKGVGYHYGYVPHAIFESFSTILGTSVDFYFTPDFTGDKVKDGDVVFDDFTIYCKTSNVSTSSKDFQEEYFAFVIMHLNDYDSSFSGTGTNKCVTDELYKTAKDFYINTLTDGARSQINNAYHAGLEDLTTPEADKSYTYKAVLRFIAWGAANGEDIYLGKYNNYSFIELSATQTIQTNANNFIIIISVLAVITLTGVAFITYKKKHN